MKILSLVLSSCIAFGVLGCKDEPKQDTPPPPPPPIASTKAGACASPGSVNDPVSAAFFPRTSLDYCVDPQGETKTYGEKGKLSMDEVCTTAFDGECEVYKRFGLKRVVSLHYVDGAGKGGSVEVEPLAVRRRTRARTACSRCASSQAIPPSQSHPEAARSGGGRRDRNGARVRLARRSTSSSSSTSTSTSRPSSSRNRARRSSRRSARSIGDKLPGSPTLPPAARRCRRDHWIPNGIVVPSRRTSLGIAGAGPGGDRLLQGRRQALARALAS